MTDAEASELLTSLRAPVMSWLNDRLPQPADADDVFGKLVVAVWRNRGHIDPPGESYLWNAARNRVRKFYRDRERAVESEWPVVPFEDNTGDRQLVRFPTPRSVRPTLTEIDVERLLGVLTPLQRSLVIDHYWKGYSGREIARRRGEHPMWANNRLKTARRKLREALP